MHFGKEVIFMVSFIMIAVTLVLAIAGVAFMFRKHSDNDSDNNSDNDSDNNKRDTKVAVIFIILAIVTAVIAVILAMFSSCAPLP